MGKKQHDSQRGYSTKFTDHQGLIAMLTKRFMGRLAGAGMSKFADFDEIFQIASLTYVKAAKGYDPALGITFAAYLGKAIANDFTKYQERLFRTGQAFTVCEADLDSYEDDESYSFMQNIASDDEDPAALTERRQQMIVNVRMLSHVAREYVRLILVPSPEFEAFVQGQSKYANKAGVTTIGRFLKHDRKTIGRVQEELRNVYGLHGTRI